MLYYVSTRIDAIKRKMLHPYSDFLKNKILSDKREATDGMPAALIIK